MRVSTVPFLLNVGVTRYVIAPPLSSSNRNSKEFEGGLPMMADVIGQLDAFRIDESDVFRLKNFKCDIE